KTMIQLLRESMPGHKFQIVPRVQKLLVGVQQTRAAMASAWIDETECADGLASLGAYRKRFNNAISAFTDEPVHDSHSNYADAFRQWAQGYDGARMAALTSSTPDWKKKLAMAKGLRRNHMTA
ncbi:MAG: terminase, partial [Stenotrophomonas sp.]|nr:terminase [Stenotrophomonas sp.]